MKLTQFKFDLPTSLIAQVPPKNREDARLMIVDRKSGKIKHKTFKELLNIMQDKDLLVMNNTRVFPARMYGRKEKTGAKIEVFLLRELNKQMRLWDVLVDPARKIRVGNKLYFGDNGILVAEVVDNTTSRGRTIRFLFDGTDDELKECLYNLGETPIPKYIKRKPDVTDKERYQTVFAKVEGAVAAPTAGLHFSRELLKRFGRWSRTLIRPPSRIRNRLADEVADAFADHDRDWTSDRKKIAERFMALMSDYVPQRYQGKVTLYRIRGLLPRLYLRFGPDMGWRSCANEIDIKIIANCKHHRMIREPFVRDLAASMRTALDGVVTQ